MTLPAVYDRDTARLRDTGYAFVKFFGWSEKKAHSWCFDTLVWDEGVGRGLLRLKAHKKARDVQLQRAKRQAEAVA